MGGTASFSISCGDFLLPPQYGEGDLVWVLTAGVRGMRMRAGLCDTCGYCVIRARLSETPEWSVLMPMCSVPAVASI